MPLHRYPGSPTLRWLPLAILGLLPAVACIAPSAGVGMVDDDSSGGSTDSGGEGSSSTGRVSVSSTGLPDEGSGGSDDTAGDACVPPSGAPLAFDFEFGGIAGELEPGQYTFGCRVTGGAFELDCFDDTAAPLGHLTLQFPVAPLAVDDEVTVAIVLDGGFQPRRSLALWDLDGVLRVAGSTADGLPASPPWGDDLAVSLVDVGCVETVMENWTEKRVGVRLTSPQFDDGEVATFVDGEHAAFSIGDSDTFDVHVDTARQIIDSNVDDGPSEPLTFGIAIAP
ncbi:MAG: hypothetical protein IPK74_29205 [Deltaproteobacteria bacterium]|nr:hypothetical protein [Deltaproteobacteria bacterium]